MSSSSLRALRPWRSIFSRGMSCSSGAVAGDSMGYGGGRLACSVIVTQGAVGASFFLMNRMEKHGFCSLLACYVAVERVKCARPRVAWWCSVPTARSELPRETRAGSGFLRCSEEPATRRKTNNEYTFRYVRRWRQSHHDRDR